MIHVGCYSGGKDSTALMLWMAENLGEPGKDWIALHERTKWEADSHDPYVEYINKTVLLGTLKFCESKTYPGGFVQLVTERYRVPSVKARFCTEELKTIPAIEFCKTLNDEVTIYMGHRREESDQRAEMCAIDFDDRYDAHIRKPLLDWTVEQVFAIHRKYRIEPNPLYKMGVHRVGCFPCVMVQLRELKALMQWPEQWAELKQRVEGIEKTLGSSFFPPNYIPKRFQKGRTEEGKSFPWCADVWRYLEKTTEDQLPLLERRSCMSVYNLCE